MSNRPLFSNSIADLELLSSQRSGDPEVRKQLLHELAHRKTPRAQKLRAYLQELNGAEVPAVTEAQVGAKKPVTDKIPEQVRTTVTPTRQDGTSPITSLKKESTPLAPQPDPAADSRGPVEKRAPFIPTDRDEPASADTASTNSLHSAPDAILNSWIAIEVLSPATYMKAESLGSGKAYDVAWFSKGGLPWVSGNKRFLKGCRKYYQIILGSIKMAPAVEALLGLYSDSRHQRPQARGNAVLASIMVDEEGVLAGQNPVVISSFGWGVPVALAGDLQQLEKWPRAEALLLAGLMDKLTVKDEEGNVIPVPLTMDKIHGAFDWLTATLGLSRELVNPPTFALCTFQKYSAAEPPEPSLLNSFFLKDLSWAKRLSAKNRLPTNLKRFLGMTPPQNRCNLLDHRERISLCQALAPGRFPAASWPGNGRHPLVLLQQCAVNLALSDLKDGGILAVNGPPGTGKTTLLRDVVAAIVTERARVMATYADPESAFTHSGQKLKRGGNAFLHLYQLDPKLRGYEIVVASSNNKAVENISVELPGRGAVAEDSFDKGYFSTISDVLRSEDTWGIISAVLGNAGNRSRFRNTFWWDDQCGMRHYLKHACGTPVFISDVQGRECVPKIIKRENPPEDHDAAWRRWQDAKRAFERASAKVEQRLGALQNAYELQERIGKHRQEIATLEASLPQVENLLRPLADSLAKAQAELADSKSSLAAVTREQKRSIAGRPGWFSRLFNRSGYRAWLSQNEILVQRGNQAQAACNETQGNIDKIDATRHQLEEERNRILQALRRLSTETEECRNTYKSIVQTYGGDFIDEHFFDRDHRDRQITAPWLDKETCQQRGDLFEAAMTLHKAFIDAAAKPIRHNLGAFLDGFGMNSLGKPERDALIPDLWATFFLLVPVVSTTFASAGAMLSNIEIEGLGWLLIDEAGQALPQAAVGSLMRTKRAMVVGDPLQIEPIVVLPETLTTRICENFGVDPNIYNPPGASVQTLADRATAYVGSFETQYGTREVGVPLLVHRRCSDPMFSISNAVAYEHLMVKQKQVKPSPIREALGGSAWIPVQGGGSGQSKWNPAEGRQALQLLERIKAAGCEPNVYLVSPFVEVQDGLREVVLGSGILADWVDEPNAWVKERIGTVHTVQGREAEAVIFVLGASHPGQAGARAWAGKAPNILNVAVTRAKEALYVIGDNDAWKNAGLFSVLHEQMVRP